MSGAFLLSAVGLGIAYAATPGVVNTECLRRGAAGGFRPAFSVQFGALLGDALWAVLALSGIAALANSASFEIVLSLAGGLVLCRLAFSAIRAALTGTAHAAGESRGGHFRTGVIFGVANPAGLAFWAGIGGGLLTARSGDVGIAESLLFLAAFLTGALIWSSFLSALVSWGRRFARPRVFRVIDGICAAVLGFFGVRLLLQGGRRFLRTIAPI